MSLLKDECGEIILSYIRSFPYLSGKLIELGFLFLAHGSLCHLSYPNIFCHMFLETLKLYMKAQKSQRISFFFKEA